MTLRAAPTYSQNLLIPPMRFVWTSVRILLLRNQTILSDACDGLIKNSSGTRLADGLGWVSRQL
jgi:hypothetical protein